MIESGRQPSMLATRVAIVALAAACILSPATGSASTDPPSGTFDGCPVTGEGSQGAAPHDSILNTLKNRSAQTDPNVYQVAELIDSVPKPSAAALRRPREDWSHEDRATVLPYEQAEARIVGYLYDAKPEGPEQPNCGAPVYHGDYHVWLIDDPSQDRTHSAVVEVTPRWREANPTWSIAALRSIAQDKERVRITGWLLFDQEHPEQLGNTRGTLWELHPITKIEVFENGAWQELESSP